MRESEEERWLDGRDGIARWDSGEHEYSGEGFLVKDARREGDGAAGAAAAEMRSMSTPDASEGNGS